MDLRSCYVLLLLLLLQRSLAAPKSLTCMSYMEDDKSLEYDDDIDEYNTAPLNAANNHTQHGKATLDGGGGGESESSLAVTMVPQHRVCQPDYTSCFAVWRQFDNGTTYIEKQGCWKESTDRNASCSQAECTSTTPTSRNTTLYYCCCAGDACNENMRVVKLPPTSQIPPEASNLAASAAAAADRRERDSVWLLHTALLWCGMFTIGLLITLTLSVFYCRRARDKAMPEEAPLAPPAGPGYSSNLRNVDNINLVAMLGSGKYGTVMKGLLHDEEVAVKIYPESHHQYYVNERNIYSLPLMDSPSLLTYYGYDERHTMEGRVEYQLVLSLAPLGCLQDWLAANTLDFDTFCLMARSITRGLSHLHTELRCGDATKPCIAHRDLNSRNVLIKADRSCCIADFGFALKVFGARYEYKGEVAMAETKSINEVGTLRYMAPELLEGAVNLRDCETSLKQMDVYALGLVLWEVATRCADFYAPALSVPPYKAPYELEVGTHPSFDQMQALVVRRKARPLFPAGWGAGGGAAAAKLVRDTCEDCWDHDAEARLTSLCAEERMQEVAGLRPRLYANAQAASPLLSANNLLHDVQGESGETTAVVAAAAARSCHDDNEPHSTGVGDVALPFNSPPNQQLPLEKNHLLCAQQQPPPMQPYQGRNPCQERNLAPASARLPPVLVERSKKHSFQSGDEHSFSCLEDDVSVEELLSVVRAGCGGVEAQKYGRHDVHDVSPHGGQQHASMGEGFPKQHNTDRKLRGWYSVRALIQKKLFRNDSTGATATTGELGAYATQRSYCDEKSNLVDNRCAAATVAAHASSTPTASDGKSDTISYITDADYPSQQQQRTAIALANGLYPPHRRPNNLDLSPSSAVGEAHKSNLIHRIAEEQQRGQIAVAATSAAMPAIEALHSPVVLRSSAQKRICTPSHVVPRSLSTTSATTAFKPNNNNNSSSGGSSDKNNNNNNSKHNHTLAHKTNGGVDIVGLSNRKAATVTGTALRDELHDASTAQQFRRQRSLEVFHEVFSGRGSSERLRDPSQRVKTPGDVPPSVRRVRASKTLSLYDDRMMTASSALSSNHNQIL